MNSSVRIGTIRGIELKLHFSWFIALIVFSYIFARGQYPALYDGWSEITYWIVGIASVLLLFLSVVVHEFGHALTAQARGVEVRNITLWIFGGVAVFEKETESPGDEFRISIAGPLASLAIAGVFGALWWVIRGTNEQLSALLGYLAFVNLILAAFNMIPGFPLDGGRVLRAALWKAMGDVRRATKIVSVIGSMVGTGFVFFGVLWAIQGSLVNGLWYIAIGWFLQNAADQGYRGTEQRELLRGITALDIANRQPTTVPVTIGVDELVHDYFLRANVRGAPVINNGRLMGIVTLTDVKEIDPEHWSTTAIRTIMTPFNKLHTVTATTDIADALTLMTEHDLNQIPVVSSDQPDELVGLLQRADFMRYLQLRMELGLLDDRQPAPSPAQQHAPST